MAKKDDKKPAKDDAEDDEKEDKKEGDEGEAGEGGEGEAPAKGGLLSGKKKFIVIGAAVLLLGGIGAGLFFTGIIGGKKEPAGEATAGAHGEAAAGEHGEKKDGEEHKIAYFDLGDIIVNLAGDGKRPNFLKIKVSLELEDEKDKPLMMQIKPRILDNFQVYLRELRIDDLKGSAGIYRLREELLLRVTEAAHPARVRDVLFQEMLVQ